MNDALSKQCAEVTEHLGELLDGSAAPRLVDHVAECDHCRDAKHEAEAALRSVRAAGADYVVPRNFADRVLTASASTSTSSDATRLAEAAQKAPAAEPASKAGTRRAAQPGASRRERHVAAGLFVLALAAAAALIVRGAKPGPTAGGAEAGSGWHGQLDRVASVGGEGVRACGSDGPCSVLARGASLLPGMRLTTDAKTRAELTLADGSRITLDRDTELELSADAPRHAKLVRGGLIADIAHASTEARFDVPNGELVVHGTKFALRADGAAAAVDVVRGSVTLADGAQRRVRVGQGESGRLEVGLPPFVGASADLGEALAWRERSFERSSESVEAPRGLGQLRAKKPGETNERQGAVTLASHSVRVRIAGAIARTEIEEVFENGTDEVLEGIYRFPMPPKAQIERLALEVDGRFEEGAFVDRDRAAAIWRGAIVNSAPKQPRPREEIVWVPGPWRDPALLEWQRGGRFELRIFPIPKRASRRVILTYTEVVPSHLGTRRYTYPLAYDPSGSSRVGKFDVNVEVRGHDAHFGARPAGYALTAGSSGDGAGTLAFSARDFAPSGDLSIEYALPDRNAELTAFTYHDERSSPLPATAGKSVEHEDRSPYVAISLRPKLPRSAKQDAHSVALVVDSSRSMLGESYRRASELAARIAAELGVDDRVTLLACGVECRVMPGGARVPGRAAADEAKRFLAEIVPEDGSDVVGAAARALEVLEVNPSRARRVVYLGDGAPTVGQIRPGSIERAVAEAVRRFPGQLTAVAVGGESDQVTLAALARGGGGVMVPYVPGSSLGEAAYAVLGASAGNALSDVSVELPEGLRAVSPRRLDAIPAGTEAFVVARMDNLELSGDVVLRGRVAGARFEQRYPVALVASTARGNAFVPRLYAATRIADLEREGTSDAKREAVALSSRFNVASRYTSLLVLESEAMFKAFGLDNRRSAPAFSGEEEAESASAAGTYELEAQDSDDGLGVSGIGSGGGGRARSGQMPAPAATSGAFDAATESKLARRHANAPSPAPAPMSPKKKEASRSESEAFVLEDPPSPRGRMVPMRRVWERFGEVLSDRSVPSRASSDALSRAERELELDGNRREAVKNLFGLSLAAGDLARAESLAERWSSKEPLDPEAITARADVLAARGDRAEAIRVLGGVLDVRPDDIAAQKRLARLARWAGKAALGCRYTLAIAELRPGDATLLADAVRCARETGSAWSADELLLAAEAATRALAETKLTAPAADDRALKGDLRIEADWSGGSDLDLALIDPDGHRISWLGAPTRALISARDVTSRSREALAVSGGKPGEYALELVRVGGGDHARGELTITVAGTTRRIPFTLDGNRTKVAIARIGMRSKLVPL